MVADDKGMTVNSFGALTINARKGETITKVILSYSEGGYRNTLSASIGTFDGNSTITGINAQQVTISSSSTAGVKISAVTVYFEGDLNNPTVTLTGGANAKSSGGLLTQSYLPGAMDTVTYTALTGASFPEFENFTQNGVTVERTSDTVVTISGTPTANTAIIVPDAVSSSKIVTWNSATISSISSSIAKDYTYTASDITLNKTGKGKFANNSISGYDSTASFEFTTTTGKFTNIEIAASAIYSGGNWTTVGNTLKWNGTPSNSVSLSGNSINVEGVSSINFVIEMPADLSTATVTLGADNTVSSITVGGNEITDLSAFDITYGTDDSHTATTPPTEDGTYYAYVSAKATSEDYTGTAKSAAFVVAAHDHNFTYTVSGATITAECSSHDGCPLASSDYKATLTISAPTTSDGKAVVTVEPAGAFGTLPAVKYKTGSEEETETPPTADGFHKASITVDGKTASVTYGMNCITYSTATNGTVSGATGATVGATVEPTIAPATGYELDTLTVKQGDQDVTVTGNKSFVMPEANVTVSATFKKINSEITLTQPANGGAVTAKIGNADVTAADYGDTITLGNAPAAGYSFGSYSVTKTGESSAVVSVSNGTFTMPEYPVTVTGTFTPINYTVTVSATTNGTVQASKTSDAHIGDEINLTVTPFTGYQLDALTVKDANNQNVTVSGSKFTMPASAVTVSATFKEITYTVTVNGATATVTDSLPTPNTYTAQLTGLPSDKTYDGEPVTLTATVQKSDGFPNDKVTVGTVSFKDQKGSTVTTATDVGTYTASATVGNKTISKSFKINGQANSITYVKTTKSGNSYTAVLATTNQYIPLVNNPNGITLLKEGRIYYAKGNIEIGALVFIGNDVKLILGKDTTVTIYAGIYHIGSSLEIYCEQGGEKSELIVNGSKTLSELTNNTEHTLDEIAGKDATLSGTIGFYSGKLTVEKGKNSKLVADDINLTLGAGVSASGLTGGTANGDGTVLYNKESLSKVDKLSLEYKAPATNTTPSSGSGSGGGGNSSGGSSSSTSSGTTTTTTTTDTTSNPDASTTDGAKTVTTTTNRDGSTTEKTTETATKSGGDGSKTEVKAEATTTTKSNRDGTTTAATTTTETATTTAADGTKTVTETKTEAKETLNKSGNGTVEAKTTETVKDASGKVTATTVTESKGTVETATDGTKTTTTTNTAVTTDAAGNKTTVVTTEKATVTTDGNTGKVVSDESGKVVSVEAKVSETAAENAAKSGETVTLPVAVTAAQSAEDATTVAITVPKAAESVKVEIPVEDVKPGTVAVIVHEDGTEEIVKTSTTSEGGVVLALESGASVKVVDNTKTFDDVDGSEWYADNVAWASSREVMNGVGNNTFAPNEDTNRAMVTQILYNLDDGKASGAVTSFNDVSAGDWYADSVSWAVENGIAQGEGESFGANDPVSREQLSVMLYNYAGKKGYDVTVKGDISRFADNDSASAWASDALAWAVGVGIINGARDAAGNTLLDPQGNASRAQVTAMTERFCQKAAK